MTGPARKRFLRAQLVVDESWAIAHLAALVVVATFGRGRELVLDPRANGVAAAAAAAIVLRAPIIVVVTLAAVVAALVRLV